MKKNVLIYFIALGLFTACQEEEGITLEAQFESISPALLPSSSQQFITGNFTGEVVTEAYKVTDSEGVVTYESFMTNNTNLVFAQDGDLSGFGDINSMMALDGEMTSEGMMGNQRPTTFSGAAMHGSGGMMGRGREHFRGRPDAEPEEVGIEDLPESIVNYLSENHPENKVLLAFIITWDEVSEYHVLVQDIGGLIFDADGNFIDRIRRGRGRCGDFEDLAIEDLSETIMAYITENYPDAEIVKARTGTHDEVTETHVLLLGTGVLIFDADDNFIEFKELRMPFGG
jgi:hypothetical protein